MNAAAETYNVINLDFEAAWEAVLVANLASAKAAEAYRQLTGYDFPEAQTFLGDCRARLIGLRPVPPLASIVGDVMMGAALD